MYIGWAYYYDVCNNFEKAEAIYAKGFDAHAEPREALEQAHVQFGFSMSRRLLHKDETHQREFQSTMEERRFALTSLRSHRHRDVGSIRTGQAVKSFTPGFLKQDNRGHGKSNAKVPVYNENQNPEIAEDQMAPPPLPTVHSILTSASKQENKREPGPWSEAKKRSKHNLFQHTINNTVDMRFSILEDSDSDLPPLDAGTPEEQQRIRNGLIINEKPFPVRSAPQTEFTVDMFIDEPAKPDVFPVYDKIMLYPSKNVAFSPEELRAYRWFKKNGIENKFTLEKDTIWGSSASDKIRLPPQFSRKNDPQTDFVTKLADDIRVFRENEKLFVCLDRLLPPETNKDVSIEELMKEKWLNGELPSQRNNLPCNESMEETIVFHGRQSICKAIRRKTVYNSNRKSIIPPMMNEDNSPTLTKENFKIPSTLYQPIPKVLSIFAPTTQNDVTKIDSQPELPPPTVKIDEELMADPLKSTGAIRKTGFRIEEDTDLTSKPLKSILKQPPISKEPEEPMEQDLSYTGAIRKSIPTKRKTVKTIPSSNEPFELPPSESKSQANTDGNRFEIFEDPTVNTVNSPAAKTLKITSKVFKTPAPANYVENNDQCQPIVDNENNARILEEPPFLPDDTCTTQHFNFFIKPLSISTPVSKRKSLKLKELEQINDAENIEPENINPATIVSCSTSSSSTSVVDTISPSNSTEAQKQLYTIMETTEPTTKSSVDTLFINTSPEDQISKSKNISDYKTTSPECKDFALSTEQSSKEKPLAGNFEEKIIFTLINSFVT